ncbi:TPA: MazF family toxin-antitoxin system [Streptococcus pyogenes]
MDSKALNKQNLSRSKKILLNISDNPKNPKFYKLSRQELERAKIFKTENLIKSQKYQRYKRGTIVFIHFGVNIGNEFSDSHFGIMLNKKDHPNNGKLTILPLTSKNSKESLSINKEIFTSIMDDAEKTVQTVQNVLNLTTEVERIHHSLPVPPAFFQIKKENKYHDIWMKYYNRHDPKGIHVPVANITVRKWIQSDLDKINFLKKRYANYDKVSYAKLDSITSVSKLKIAKPINDLDPVGKITLSKEIMDNIDKALARQLLSGQWGKLDN